MTAPSDAQDRDIRAVSVNFNESRHRVEVIYANGLNQDYDLESYHRAIADGTINVDTAQLSFNDEIADESEIARVLYDDNSSHVPFSPELINSTARSVMWAKLADVLPFALALVALVALVLLGIGIFGR